jgi:polysaccharide pyruvyl transferase WcaK-like protein
MKILILNDTSKYHNGSKHVIKFLTSTFKDHDITLSKKIKEKVLKGYDLIIINGEGTMHNNAKKAISLLKLANYAKHKLGIKIMLVNSVWQKNTEDLTNYLNDFDYVGVREILSKNEITKCINKDIEVHLDLSYYLEVPYQKYQSANIVAGNFYTDKSSKNKSLMIKNIGEDSTVDIFNESWNTVVNKLRHAKLLVTGRHHEMYAACKARCFFIILEGNTHKNSGLLKTFGVNIPVLSRESSINEIKQAIINIDKYKEEYIKLFNAMESQPLPRFTQNT